MKTKFIITIILITTFLSSCIDVIELDLENVEPRIIIEATLNATDSTCQVKATYTNDFYDTTPNETIDNLTVKLFGPNDEVYNLELCELGCYKVEGIVAVQGDEFTVSVTDSAGVEYVASAVTPGNIEPINFQQILSFPFLTLFTNFEGGPPPAIDSLGNERKRLFAINYWLDIPNEENYYRFKIYEDGVYQNESYNFVDDKSAFSDTMQMGLSSIFLENDTVGIELSVINKATYDFYQQLMDVQMSGMNSTTPYNPKGNFSNEAIGFFCIETTVYQEIVVFEFEF